MRRRRRRRTAHPGVDELSVLRRGDVRCIRWYSWQAAMLGKAKEKSSGISGKPLGSRWAGRSKSKVLAAETFSSASIPSSHSSDCLALAARCSLLAAGWRKRKQAITNWSQQNKIEGHTERQREQTNNRTPDNAESREEEGKPCMDSRTSRFTGQARPGKQLWWRWTRWA